MAVDTQSKSYKWGIFLPSLVFLGGAVLFTVYWFVMAGRYEEGLARWVQEQSERGVQVNYSGAEIKGFPYRFEAHLKDVSVSQPGHPNALVWQSEDVIAMMLSYRFDKVMFESKGRQTFTYIEDLGPEARRPERYLVDATASALRGSAVLKDGQPQRISIDIQDIAADRAGDMGASQKASAARMQLHIRPAQDDNGRVTDQGAEIFIKAEDVNVPVETNAKSASDPITLVQAKITLENYDQETMMDEEYFETWLKDGGRVHLTDLAFTWDQFGLQGEGMLTLDSKFYPKGSISTQMYGHSQMIDRLVAMGTIEKQSGQMADAALSLLAAVGGNKGGGISAPLDFKKGGVYIGPARLSDLDPVYDF